MSKITDISPLIQLLGEGRVERIKDEIAQLIIDRIKSDLDTWDNYIFYPPEHKDMFNEAFNSIQKKAKKMYSTAILERVKKDAEKIVNQEVDS